MRQPSRRIWESASRPLFVRSVWLETANEGRSHRRHFILDYEPRERERWQQHSRSQTIGSPERRRRGGYKQTQSYDLYEEAAAAYNDSVEYLDEYLLLDATKLTLRQQQQQQQHQQQQSHGGQSAAMAPPPALSSASQKATRHAKRRAWLLSRGKTYNSASYASRDHCSRRSSLQDVQSTLSSSTAANPEERLAERVLNWLDLAGRTDILKAATPSAPSSAQLPRSSQRGRHAARSRLEGGGEMGRRSAAAGFKRVPTAARRMAKTTQQMTTTMAPATAPANAKPITIIFNKEGVPVRLNRAARNIDLCALSHSASATRRLAGQLASARLYSGAASTPSPRAQQSEEGRTPPHSGRATSSTAAADCKKQLHIFMPSLPKKGLLAAAGSEDGGQSGSQLSATFSELCQI